MPSDLHIETFPVGMLGCNCTIIGDPDTGDALVIDPGDEPDEVCARLDALGLHPAALIHTHAHFDHIGRSSAVAMRTGSGMHLHEGDLFLYENLATQAEWFGLSLPPGLPLAGFLKDADVIGRGRASVEVVHTPGHTPGSDCFRLAGPVPMLFSGDTLFAGGIGRTDLWGGDGRLIVRSIRERLYTLSPETRVIPGHGPETTIDEERASNPFVQS